MSLLNSSSQDLYCNQLLQFLPSDTGSARGRRLWSGSSGLRDVVWAPPHARVCSGAQEAGRTEDQMELVSSGTAFPGGWILGRTNVTCGCY